MKSYKIIGILFLFIIISSCSISKKISKNLIGNWKIESVEFVENENNTEHVINTIKGITNQSYIEFTADKKYKLHIADKELYDTWTVSEDGKQILSSETERYFEIISFIENQLILESINSKSKVIIKLQKN
jgi:hypothetical protein